MCCQEFNNWFLHLLPKTETIWVKKTSEKICKAIIREKEDTNLKKKFRYVLKGNF